MNSRPTFPMWLYFAVAALIAGVGFAIGQISPGAGVPVVVLLTTFWTAFAVARQSKWRKTNG